MAFFFGMTLSYSNQEKGNRDSPSSGVGCGMGISMDCLDPCHNNSSQISYRELILIEASFCDCFRVLQLISVMVHYGNSRNKWNELGPMGLFT